MSGEKGQTHCRRPLTFLPARCQIREARSQIKRPDRCALARLQRRIEDDDMPIMKRKVFASITHGDRLLVFSHSFAPEAGMQVPAGTVNDGEDPDSAVMREAYEEAGRTD